MLARPAIPLALALTFAVTAAMAVEPPAEPEKAKEPLICRGAARQLGSRIRTPRRCKTAEQWRQEDEARARLPVSGQITEGQDRGAQRPQS